MSSNHYEWKIGEPPPVLGEHSVAKHEIFEQYLRIYIDRLTRTPSQTILNLTIVDGFSGGGLYRRGGREEVEGSPLRLLRAVDVADQALAAARSKGFTIQADFFFVDREREHVEFLINVLKGRGYGRRLDHDVFVVCSEFEEACPNILQHIQKKGRAHRSLFFLDQYGWSDVRLATIRTVLGSLKNPEILLTFAVDSLIDFLSEKKTDTSAYERLAGNRPSARRRPRAYDHAKQRRLALSDPKRPVPSYPDPNRSTFLHPVFHPLDPESPVLLAAASV